MATQCFEHDALEFAEDNEVLVDDVEFFSVLEFALQEANFLEVVELTANRINLLIQFSSEFTDKVLIVGMKEEEREQLDSSR